LFPEIKGRRILFFDLDTVIIGNINKFLKYDGYLCAIKPFNQINHDRSTPGGILSFVSGETSWIWDKVRENHLYYAKHMQGKERFVLNSLEPKQKWDRWQDILPGLLISYKKHVLRQTNTAGASVIAFHGNPRPHEAAIQDQFIKGNWR
jgi:hypothetical protein